MLPDAQSLKTLVSCTLASVLVVADRRVTAMHITTSFPEAVGFVFYGYPENLYLKYFV